MSDEHIMSPGSEYAEQIPTPAEQDVDKLIIELRASLESSQTLLKSQSTRLAGLSDLETELSQLRDKYAFITAAKEAVEKQLQVEKTKRETAEELIEELKSQMETLRGQVDQARRGVGLLQKQEKERKRMSQIGGLGLMGGIGNDLRASPESALAEAPEKPEKSSKRQSILIPNRAHRRTSSHSEGSDHVQPPTSVNATPTSTAAPSTSPNPTSRPGLRELRLGSQPTPPSGVLSPNMALDSSEDGLKGTRRVSNASNVQTSPPLGGPVESPGGITTGSVKESDEKAEQLEKEVKALQKKLVDSEEARIASETCLKALREFIASGNGASDSNVDLTDPASVGALKGISLPPLPTDRDADELDQDPKPLLPPKTEAMKSPRKGSSWGFSLWRQPSSPAISTVAEAPSTPQPLLSPAPFTRTNSTISKTTPLPTAIELTEPAVEAVEEDIPSTTTTRSRVNSWTKTIPPQASTPKSPPPIAPNTTRKLSSFFGLGRKDTLPESHEFDAHDAFTPEQHHIDKLEPSPMIPDGYSPVAPGGADDDDDEEHEGNNRDSRRTSAPSPETAHTALTEDLNTPALSPLSVPLPMLEENGKSLVVEDGEYFDQRRSVAAEIR